MNFLEYLTTKEYCDTINEGADALPGNKKYGTLAQMHNDKYPDEDIMNELTLEATKWGVVRELSPFIDGQTALRLIGTQVQRLEASADVDVDEVCRTAARDVNDEMRRNVESDARLKMIWDQLQRKSARRNAT